MKGYKAFNAGLTAYNGFKYEVGKEYEITGNVEMCKNGFHFCKNLIDVFGYYPFDRKNTMLAEVEASGKILHEGTKYCAEKIMIVREIGWDEVENLIAGGRCNSGRYNSGDHNSGHYNSGDYNSGHHNSGHYNIGDHNIGDHNIGRCNSGDYNIGRYNSGNYNSGHYNSGHYNSGHYNSGNYNSGFFNSNTPTVRMFNKDSGMTFEDFYNLGINFADLRKSRKIIEKLPNYDAQIFFDTTGIDWRSQEET